MQDYMIVDTGIYERGYAVFTSYCLLHVPVFVHGWWFVHICNWRLFFPFDPPARYVHVRRSYSSYS